MESKVFNPSAPFYSSLQAPRVRSWPQKITSAVLLYTILELIFTLVLK